MNSEKIGTLGDRIGNRVVRHFPGPRNVIECPQPIVSFSFDDAPISAATDGAAILEAHGARGTFYIAGRLANEEPQIYLDEEQCRSLSERGHEIACHTYAHRKVGGYRALELEADLSQNAAFLQEVSPRQERRNFAFPYGMMSPLRQGQLRRRFRTARSIMPGINRGLTDLYNLASVELRPDPAFLQLANDYVDDLARAPGWLIFFTHDVAAQPSAFGSTPDALIHFVKRVEAIGAKIMTVEAAADYLKLPK